MMEKLNRKCVLLVILLIVTIVAIVIYHRSQEQLLVMTIKRNIRPLPGKPMRHNSTATCQIPASTKANTNSLLESQKNFMSSLAFYKIQSGINILTEKLPEVQLSQNYDDAVGETLQSLLSRESQPKNTQTGLKTFTASRLKLVTPSTNQHRVQPLLHYVLFYENGQFQFHHMVCILSAFWRLQPRYMILWHNHPFQGANWDYLKRNFTSVAHRIVLMPATAPKQIYGNRVDIIEHRADIVRLEVLYVFGGIYLDHDALVVKSFQPLYRFPFTIGRETGYGLCNGIIMSERQGYFVHVWHLFYRHYESNWALNSVMLPHGLKVYFASLMAQHKRNDTETCIIHVEEDSMDRPNWTQEEVAWLYGRKRVWNWRQKNYAVHLWFRKAYRYLSWTTVKTEDSMYGDMCREVLFGSSS